MNAWVLALWNNPPKPVFLLWNLRTSISPPRPTFAVRDAITGTFRSSRASSSTNHAAAGSSSARTDSISGITRNSVATPTEAASAPTLDPLTLESLPLLMIPENFNWESHWSTERFDAGCPISHVFYAWEMGFLSHHFDSRDARLV